MPDDSSLPARPPTEGQQLEELLRDLYLSDRERRWVEVYVQTGSHRKAAQALGETMGGGGMNPHYGRWEVRAAVARLQAHYSRKIGLETERILAGLKAEAFHDPAEIYEDDGASWNLKPLDEWPLELRQCVQEINTHTTVDPKGNSHTYVKVKFADRQKAKELLGRHLRMWEAEKNQVVPYTLIIHQHATPDAVEAAKPVQTLETEAFRIEMPE
jgi:hypothetical protein